MKYAVFILLVIILNSCQFFETEKISSETFYEQEKAQLDWKDVDRYPTFPACMSFTEKAEQKKCFETTVLDHLYRSIENRDLEATQALHDTLWIEFVIAKNGELILRNPLDMDSLTKASLPHLTAWIQESMDSLPRLEPAYKRGIPVRSHYSFPLVLATTD
ncbi:hypothetical protein [Altibacter sp. HG106]|uniref:hypothetical protein n=1 Tax=Altibacter sp. HG106 TaxID=3023937 RepID=UPI0023507726|nr:hypothetical protein [Altibacter sp. HG106]MDC7994067.1 hypothetical protein [Altibacter sp. HG106]